MRTAFLLVGLLIGSATLFGNPITLYPYQVVACGGTGQPACTVHGITNVQPVPGLTNADFQSFFSFVPGGATGTYTWTVTDVNSSGVAIGDVFDFNINVRTSFVFDKGQLLCCTTDRPFRLADINDNGLVVGGFPSGLGNPDVGLVADCCGNLTAQVPLSITFTTPAPIFYFFTAIDDNNNIAALGANQQYDLLESPEPSSILLLAGVAAVVTVVARSGRKKNTAARTSA